jgi:hypothetical protein
VSEAFNEVIWHTPWKNNDAQTPDNRKQSQVEKERKREKRGKEVER